jgi:alpha-galactosidase
MKTTPVSFPVLLGLVALLMSEGLLAQTRIPTFAPTPPLGFNSFDSYLVYLSEDKARDLIDVMAEKYLPFGYDYFVIDAGWAQDVELYPGSMYPKRKLGVSMDEFGLVEPCKMYFPSGIKALADRCHQKGLKFGVWIIRGIPREAVKRNLPIKGTSYFARDIADTSSICSWSADNYGVDMSKPGAQEYYNALINKLAGWGVDFIKLDDVVPNPREIVAVARAIEQGGHRITYSLSPGDVYQAADLPHFQRANMLRITGDVWDNSASIEKGFVAWEKFQGTAKPGFWPDLDMIPFGRLTVVATPDIPGVASLPADRRARQSMFTPTQMRTFIAQRALAASPLIIGGDLLTMDDFSYCLLTNREMLACNQNGVSGANIYRAHQVDIWKTSDKSDPGKGWIGIFNRGQTAQTLTFTKQQLGFVAYVESYKLTGARQSFLLTDVWTGESSIMTDRKSFDLPAEGVAFLRYEMQ